jgi:hypothetical protein
MRAWIIKDGAADEHTTDSDELVINLGRNADSRSITNDLHESGDWPGLLPVIVDIATRVTPHVIWLLGPALPDDRFARGLGGGFATWHSGIVAISTGMETLSTVRVAYHEAWHALEEFLTSSEFQTVRDAVAGQSPEWADPYLMQSWEQRADTFAAYALARHLGIQIPASAHAPENRVFEAVYNGTVGQRIKRRGGLTRILQDFGPGIRAAVPQVRDRATSRRLLRYAVRVAQAVYDEVGWPCFLLLPLIGLLAVRFH